MTTHADTFRRYLQPGFDHRQRVRRLAKGVERDLKRLHDETIELGCDEVLGDLFHGIRCGGLYWRGVWHRRFRRLDKRARRRARQQGEQGKLAFVGHGSVREYWLASWRHGIYTTALYSMGVARKRARKSDENEYVAGVRGFFGGMMLQADVAAREMIKDNRPPGSTGRRVWQLPSGLVRCSGCGTRMTQYASAAVGRIYAYYRCACLARLGKGSCTSLEGYRSRKNHRAENVERLVWEFVSDLLKDPAHLREDLERMIELEKSDSQGDPEAAAKACHEKLAEADQMRRGFQEQAARGYMTFDELGVALDELAKTRRTAERELAALQSRREVLEQLELDKEALLEHYARIAPEALDSLTPEERHQLYKMLRLEVLVRPDSSLEVSGVFGEAVSLRSSELVP